MSTFNSAKLGVILTFNKLRHEFPGKVLPSLPRKETSSQTAVVSTTLEGNDADDADDADLASSPETLSSSESRTPPSRTTEKTHSRAPSRTGGLLSTAGNYFTRNSSSASVNSIPSIPPESKQVLLWRENQRITFRGYLRTSLADPEVAKSKSMRKFLLSDPTTMTEADRTDEVRRREVDLARVEEQKNFFQIAQKRAHELDLYMEGFRRDIVENSKHM